MRGVGRREEGRNTWSSQHKTMPAPDQRGRYIRRHRAAAENGSRHLVSAVSQSFSQSVRQLVSQSAVTAVSQSFVSRR